jgi:hypothetical protein
MIKIKELIYKSLYKGDKPSSSRIFSYIMMIVIFLLGLSHIIFEFGNAIASWKDGKAYVPSWESITITAMWLAHQLTLLGIYKNAESLDIKDNLLKKDK